MALKEEEREDPGPGYVNTECFLKLMSRGSFYRCRLWVLLHPTDYSKNVFCFLFQEQLGHSEL